LFAGVLITMVDVFFILLIQNNRFRILEYLVVALTATIFVCLVYLVIISDPEWGKVFLGLLPSGQLFTNPNELFIAIGIIGATVMPHNLFLHGALVQTRNFPRTIEGKKDAVWYATIDSNLSLFLAFLINASLLILAGATLYKNYSYVSDLGLAYVLLVPILGVSAASLVFGIGLLASGQQASLTGTLAGQIVMEGMTNIKIAPWKRRLLTRLPALIVTASYPSGAGKLLIISQVILSITLSFATVPLVMITSDVRKMGVDFVNSRFTKVVSWAVVLFIACLNAYIVCSPATWAL